MRKLADDLTLQNAYGQALESITGIVIHDLAMVLAGLESLLTATFPSG